ncbi:MAG: acyl-CoA thioester hydrolase/BAAT C-terminal domain-containing protein [Thermoplasmata archaeon]
MVFPLFSGCLEEGGQDSQEDSEEITISHPDEVQMDKKFNITVNGLTEGTNYSINMTSKDQEGISWSNKKEFVPDDSSFELTANQTMSMIQMMEPVDRMLTDPYARPRKEYGVSWNLTVSVEEGNKTLKTTNITRTFGDPAVSHHSVETENIVGEMFTPPGDEPAPGVLVLHGSEGEPLVNMAHMLASNGFAALAVQYYGTVDDQTVDQIPATLDDIPIEYINKSGNWLLDQERVEGEQVGIIGVSKGGELALVSSSHFDTFGPTVSISGSGVVWGKSGNINWRYQGEPVPYIPFSNTYTESLREASEEEIQNGTVAVENINGPILAVSGGDDGMLPSVKFTNMAMDRLGEQSFPYEYEFLVYEDAGHAIRVPYLPTKYRGMRPVLNKVMGGTQEGNMKADSGYWPRTLETLGTVGS